MEINDNVRFNASLKSYYLVPQSMITITEEALRLRANEAINHYRIKSDLIAKLVGSTSIFFSLLVSYLTTSEFRFFILSPDVWQAFFVFCLLFSAGFSVYFGIKLYLSPNPEDFVQNIINDSREVQELSSKAEKFTLLPQPDWLVTKVPTEFRDRAKQQHKHKTEGKPKDKPFIDVNSSSDWLINPIPAEFRERAKKQHEKQPQ